jgi:uncharacterized protein (DUF1697 family)
VSKNIALLRGINVGKNKRIAMADLRELLAGLGYGDVKTLLQSGNAVFTARARPEALQRQIEDAIEARFGFDVSVMVRTARELEAIVEENPIPEGARDGSKLHVLFLSAKPAAATLRGIDPAAFEPEELAVRGREIYLWCKNGVRESKLFGVFSDARLGVKTTARNWNTVTKLLALTR